MREGVTKNKASQGVLWTRKEWRCPYLRETKSKEMKVNGVEAYDNNIERMLMMMLWWRRDWAEGEKSSAKGLASVRNARR